MAFIPPASISSQLTLAMPTELAFNSVMPWFVLSPRSHMPKSCEPGTASDTQKGFESHPSVVLPEGAGVAQGELTAVPTQQSNISTPEAHPPSPAYATHRSFVGSFNVEHEVLDKVDFIQAVNYVEA